MRKAFTLVEMMIVSVILIMAMGVIYSYYMNMTRAYFRGSENVLKTLDAQLPLEVMVDELRSCVRILELKPDLIVFEKYYEAGRMETDPVKDLNAITHKTVSFRVNKDDNGFYLLERREDRDFFAPLQPVFKSKDLDPNVFRGFKMVKGELLPYDSFKYNTEDIPLVEIRLHFNLSDNQDVDFYKRVFLAVPFSKIPKFNLQEDFN